jgi:hypothetical protein
VAADANCRSQIGGSYCNVTDCCLTDIEMRFTFRKYSSGSPVAWDNGVPYDAYVNGSATEGDERYVPVDATQVVRFFLPYASADDISVAKFRFKDVGCESNESLEIALSVHIADTTCELPVAAVPTWITDIWTARDVPAVNTVRAVATRFVAMQASA